MTMSVETIVGAAIGIAILCLAVQAFRVRRRRVSVGPAAAGSMYDLLNEERRKAIEIVVEDKAAWREPEDADGNLPDLEKRGGAP